MDRPSGPLRCAPPRWTGRHRGGTHPNDGLSIEVSHLDDGLSIEVSHLDDGLSIEVSHLDDGLSIESLCIYDHQSPQRLLSVVPSCVSCSEDLTQMMRLPQTNASVNQ
ncbi:hypothetical protein PCANC_19422 [Puccinia coronata f. sp. avenae]|uniref:Uncharacterized protein n=1 Tax=Puccinia coronata f. sp. avenae TaxID=200324 RepID=A0A2N5V160_9BASI|nr:hypothetical protein PCANC_19422 [Puccinia coronata f. sp. avenae]